MIVTCSTALGEGGVQSGKALGANPDPVNLDEPSASYSTFWSENMFERSKC